MSFFQNSHPWAFGTILEYHCPRGQSFRDVQLGVESLNQTMLCNWTAQWDATPDLMTCECESGFPNLRFTLNIIILMRFHFRDPLRRTPRSSRGIRSRGELERELDRIRHKNILHLQERDEI